MFGLFSSKKAPSPVHTPVEGDTPASDAPPTPAPEPVANTEIVTEAEPSPMIVSDTSMAIDGVVDGPPTLLPEDLPALIRSVPAQTLYEYTLFHLPNTPEPTLSALVAFFALLTPPPVLHCVRCHSAFTDVENNERACRVAHDDESAEVERVGVGRRGAGATFETRWGCCGKTVEGDGDQGPPDGWCYEGAHTIDVKRARFRADSTLANDKLISCTRKRCFKPVAPVSSRSSSPSVSSTATRKRGRPSRAKKSMGHVATPPAEEPTMAEPEATDAAEPSASTSVPTPTTPAKRQRGRPRKSAAPVPDEAEEAPALNTRARSRSRSRARTPGPPPPLAAVIPRAASSKPVSRAASAKPGARATGGRRKAVKSAKMVEESGDDDDGESEAKRRKVE